MRTRTGCMTCRQRKLKCSEEKPTCAQCSKASRTCIPASGITFRHQQNPSMNKNQESLKRFYGYKETFAKAAQWVPVSKELTWIHTSNPYDDNEDDEPEQQRSSEPVLSYPPREPSDMSPADYSAFTEGLAALSAVASQDHFAQAQAAMQQESMQPTQQTPANQPLEYVLNPGSRTTRTEHQLDPQLQMLDTGAAHSPPYAQPQSSAMSRDAPT